MLAIKLSPCWNADALQNTDTSCTWHGTNYPSVDFGAVGSVASIEACFRTATATINSNDGNFRGIVAAATAEYAPLLQEESFVRGVLATLPLACEFNTGTPRNYSDLLCSSVRIISAVNIQVNGWKESGMPCHRLKHLAPCRER